MLNLAGDGAQFVRSRCSISGGILRKVAKTWEQNFCQARRRTQAGCRSPRTTTTRHGGNTPQGMSCFSLTLVLGIKKSLRAYCSEGFSSEKSATEDRQPDGRSGRAALASWLCAPRFHVVCSFLCVMRFSHAHCKFRSPSRRCTDF